VSAPADCYDDLAFLGKDGQPRSARRALLFLDLLGVAEMAISSRAGEVAPRMQAHRDALADKLKAHRANSRVWEKHRWLSEYHNHFCNERKDEDWFTLDLLIPDADLAQGLHPAI
jgi:hypothetical protein